jgi:hypothetical protein
MTLEPERDTFNSRFQELNAHNHGRFVLIQGTEISGIFDTYKDAIEAGYERFGLNSFLVKKIAPENEQIATISRFILPIGRAS